MELLAPDLIWAEVGNALWRKWRVGGLDARAVTGILNDFRRYPVQIHRADLLYDAAWEVAQRASRTFYDSLYLATAVVAGCPLVSADQRFYHALRKSPWDQFCLGVEDVP